MAGEYDAVLIVAFGGPEKLEDVMPFLERVVHGRGVPRQRLLKVAGHYELFGGKSANNDLCQQLVQALQVELSGQGLEQRVYWGNRNWHPYLADTMRQMRRDGVGRALAFFTSVYSSYSSCRQYLEDIEQARQAVGPDAPQVDKLRSCFNHPVFIELQCESVAAALQQVPSQRRRDARIIFTAHSLPSAMAEQCSYEAQLRQVAELACQAIGQIVPWTLAFQSRSGRPTEPWLEPDVCDHVRQLRQQDPDIEDVVIVPVGFIWDHMEVLYDLDIELAQVCAELGVNMIRAATIGTQERFVSMIREQLVERITNPTTADICPDNCCPAPIRSDDSRLRTLRPTPDPWGVSVKSRRPGFRNAE
jgi:ferrochelatase